MTDLLPILFILVCAVCAALSLAACGYTGSTLRQFSRIVADASTTLNGIIDRITRLTEQDKP